MRMAGVEIAASIWSCLEPELNFTATGASGTIGCGTNGFKPCTNHSKSLDNEPPSRNCSLLYVSASS